MDRQYIPVIILHLSIVAKKILLQQSHNYGVWNHWQQKLLYCICYTLWIDWHMNFGLEQEGGSLEFDCPHGAGISSPSHCQQVEEQASKPMGWMMCFLLMTFVPIQKLCVNISIYMHFLYEFFFLWLTNCVLLSDDNSITPGCLWLLAFVLNNTLILGIWCSTIPHLPGCFCPWTFFQNIGFNMVPSETFVSHLATELIFFLYFDICNYISLETSCFLASSLLLKYSLFYQVLLYKHLPWT